MDASDARDDVREKGGLEGGALKLITLLNGSVRCAEIY